MTTTRLPRGEPVPRQAPLVVALVPAAGRGLRMGGSVPKQFLSLGGEPLIIQSLRALQAAPSGRPDHSCCSVCRRRIL